MSRIELETPALPMRCTTDCATSAPDYAFENALIILQYLKIFFNLFFKKIVAGGEKIAEKTVCTDRSKIKQQKSMFTMPPPSPASRLKSCSNADSVML